VRRPEISEHKSSTTQVSKPPYRSSTPASLIVQPLSSGRHYTSQPYRITLTRGRGQSSISASTRSMPASSDPGHPRSNNYTCAPLKPPPPRRQAPRPHHGPLDDRRCDGGGRTETPTGPAQACRAPALPPPNKAPVSPGRPPASALDEQAASDPAVGSVPACGASGSGGTLVATPKQAKAAHTNWSHKIANFRARRLTSRCS
jgi:hypothetical protein